jgi:hypothetical protein
METEEKLNYGDIAVGDYLSETQYYKVTKKTRNGYLEVENERGFSFRVAEGIVREGMVTANQFEKEHKVNRTELGEILRGAGDSVFTVNFNKKIKQKDFEQALFNAVKRDNGQFNSYDTIQKNIKKAVKEHFKGEERTLVGYLCRTGTTPTGHSLVIDLEQPKEKHRIRQVDHRTVNWLILGNQKYIVK